MSACLLFETLNNYGLKLKYYIYGEDVNLYIYIFGVITLAGLVMAAVNRNKRGRIQQKFGKHI